MLIVFFLSKRTKHGFRWSFWAETVVVQTKSSSAIIIDQPQNYPRYFGKLAGNVIRAIWNIVFLFFQLIKNQACSTLMLRYPRSILGRGKVAGLTARELCLRSHLLTKRGWMLGITQHIWVIFYTKIDNPDMSISLNKSKSANNNYTRLFADFWLIYKLRTIYLLP